MARAINIIEMIIRLMNQRQTNGWLNGSYDESSNMYNIT